MYTEIKNPSPDLAEYYIVNDNQFNSFSDIQEFFYTIYKKEEADEYFDIITTDHSDEFGTFPIMYIEKNGVLYIHKDCIDNGWRISDSYIIRSAGGERIDDNNLIVTAYAYRDDKDTGVFSTFKLTYINGNWIFNGN